MEIQTQPHVPTDGTGIGTGVLTTNSGYLRSGGRIRIQAHHLGRGWTEGELYVRSRVKIVRGLKQPCTKSDFRMENRQSNSVALTGGSEKLKGLSEHNGKIYLRLQYRQTQTPAGGIARLGYGWSACR